MRRLSIIAVLVCVLLAACGPAGPSTSTTPSTAVPAAGAASTPEQTVSATASAAPGAAAQPGPAATEMVGAAETSPASAEVATPQSALATAEATVASETVATSEAALQLMSNWQQGDTRRLELRKERKRSNDTSGQNELASITDITLEVVDSTDDGYILRWTQGKTTFENAPAGFDPSSDPLLSLGNGIQVEYQTDQAGAFTGLHNTAALKAKVDEIVSKLLEQAAQSGATEQQVEQIRQNMAALTSSDEQLAAVFARDIQLYHFPLGGVLDVGQPVEYEDQVANPFGGQPFPSKAQVVLKEYDPGAGRAVIEWEQTLDPEKSKTILVETLSALARQQGSEAPKEGDLPDPFSIVDTATFVVDTKAGWVTSMDYQRNATVGPQSEVDITKITDRTE